MPIDDPSMEPCAEVGMAWCEIAASAYRAYAVSTGRKNYQGFPMPEWYDLPLAIQTAWEAAARQVERCMYHPAIAAQSEEHWSGWIPPQRRGEEQT